MQLDDIRESEARKMQEFPIHLEEYDQKIHNLKYSQTDSSFSIGPWCSP